jgi:V/A-type H+-transporting ATPase subunit I
MRRLSLLAISDTKRELFRDLSNCGCVEIESGEKILSGADSAMKALLAPSSERNDAAGAALATVGAALSALNRYAPAKIPLFEPKPRVTVEQLFDGARRAEALAAAEKINDCAKKINALHGEEGRMTAKKLSLLPWQGLDTPLNYGGGKKFVYVLGVCPAALTFNDITAALDEFPCSRADLISSDRNQHYISLIYHIDSYAAADKLKAMGFSVLSFKEYEGNAAANISAIDKKIAENTLECQQLAAEIASLADRRALLREVFDALSLENSHEKLLLTQGETRVTTYMEGWTPAGAEEAISAVLREKGCAYEFADPQEEDDPPVLLKNSSLVSPFGAITELYGLPAYNSIIDPNPFVAFFFFLFFGMMLSDAAYGLILAAISFVYLYKAKPTGAVKRFITVAFCVGLSSFGWGAVFGSWFGDVIPALSTFVTGERFDVRYVFDPLAEPMKMLILSLSLGLIHLFIGMGIAFVRLCKQKRFKDAVFDIGFWYVIIVGLLFYGILGAKAGLWVAVIGALGIVFTGGRQKPSIIGKFISGLGSLYGITSYLSDVLSYSRLMALGLATGVIASVINTMGTLAGNTVLGWILFVIVFIIGQTFNLAINLLGAFVHTCRLQYVEFFGKFFEGGGRAFAPLCNKTKFVNVVKEDN